MNTAAGQRVFLHLGAPKTGTTSLQNIMWRNRELLAQAGVLYPGDRPEAHFQAAVELQGSRFRPDGSDEEIPGSWESLVAEARQWPGTVILSHELLCTAQEAEIDRALSDLAFAEVHLVCTARDLARQIPAVWQEDIKNRHMVSFTEFVGSISGSTQPAHWLSEVFWDFQDLPRVLGKWSRTIPPDRVHVVTVPPPGQPFSLLWQRFAELLGVDPEQFDTSGGPRNKSLGVAETELIHRLNQTLEGRLSRSDYDSVVKHQLVTRIFGSRKPETPLELPDQDQAWVHDRAKRLTADLANADYHVLGDLQDLIPASAAPATHHPDHANGREVLDVAVEALAGLIEDVAAQPAAPQGVRQTLGHLSKQHPALSRIHALYHRLRELYRRLQSTRHSK